MVGAYFVEQLAYREHLADGADEEIVAGFMVDEHFARVEVHDAEAPDRAVVDGLVEYRADIGRDVRAPARRAAALESKDGCYDQ